jgi:translation initiation factor 3 subunit A
LDTRFTQLNVAVQLELWQEAFRTIEDIHSLLESCTKAPKSFQVAKYYENLAKIFLVGDNYLFHAAALGKYYESVRTNKNLSEQEQARHCTFVLLSSLAIPSHQKSNLDVNKLRDQKLMSLLRVEMMPSRDELVKSAVGFQF